MKKSLTISAVLILISLIAAPYFNYGGTQIGLLIDNSVIANIVRTVLIAGLVLISLTVRPRSLSLRLVLGAVAVFVVGYGVSILFSQTPTILDTAVYLLASCILGIEALEEDVKVVQAQPQLG